MKAQITYEEAGRLLSDRTGQDIILSCCGDPSRVMMAIHGISIFVWLESVSDDEIVLSHQVGEDLHSSGSIFNLFVCGAQALAQNAVNAILERYVDNPAVMVGTDNKVHVSLKDIPALDRVMQHASLDGVRFEEDGINLDITLL